MNVCLFYHIIKTTGIFSAVYTIELWSIRKQFLSSLIVSFQIGDILKDNSDAPLILSQQNSKRIGKPSTTIFRNSNYTYN